MSDAEVIDLGSEYDYDSNEILYKMRKELEEKSKQWSQVELKYYGGIIDDIISIYDRIVIPEGSKLVSRRTETGIKDRNDREIVLGRDIGLLRSSWRTNANYEISSHDKLDIIYNHYKELCGYISNYDNKRDNFRKFGEILNEFTFKGNISYIEFESDISDRDITILLDDGDEIEVKNLRLSIKSSGLKLSINEGGGYAYRRELSCYIDDPSKVRKRYILYPLIDLIDEMVEKAECKYEQLLQDDLLGAKRKLEEEFMATLAIKSL